MKHIYLILLLMVSCTYNPYVNREKSSIGDINNQCLTNEDWYEVFKEYNINDIIDSNFIKKIPEFKNKRINTDLLYFDSNPKEIIAIDKNRYFIYYVFNPQISSKIIDNSSIEELEKKRVNRRIDSVLSKYHCR